MIIGDANGDSFRFFGSLRNRCGDKYVQIDLPMKMGIVHSDVIFSGVFHGFGGIPNSWIVVLF